MDFTYTPEQDKFRAEIRDWLEHNSAEAFGRGGEGLGGSTASLLDVRDDQRWNQLLDYHRRLYNAGYVAMHWPKEWGGGGADMIDQSIYQDEVLRLGLPLYGANQLAIDRIGPTIMHLGTEEQKKRHLAPMLTGEQIWCQGYSEPGAGSDLAGLQTRAVLDGDNFVVNGQKVWTSLAHRADWQVLLVRTDPTAPKHKGISYLLVDMHSPGITVRPLVQITGDAGFNEVFPLFNWYVIEADTTRYKQTGVHVVYDGVGKTTFDKDLNVLHRRGYLVLFGGASGPVPPFESAGHPGDEPAQHGMHPRPQPTPPLPHCGRQAKDARPVPGDRRAHS